MVQPCAKPDRLVITKTPSAFRYPRKNILGMSMSIIQKKRLLRRLLIHHLPLLTLSAAGVFLFYVMRPVRDTITRLSFATAYPALILMAATLLIGPLNLLRGKRTPISSDWRRDVGIWAGILALIHTVIGQDVHLRGRPWLYYIYRPGEAHVFPLRHDLFGFSNYTGLCSALLLLLLLATSNDYAIRALDTPRWKQLQRLNYLAFSFGGAHALGYQAIEKQRLPFVAVVLASILITAVLQTIGYARRRKKRLGKPRVFADQVSDRLKRI
jgi:sulfoxide reductase heme-binding subunit YedZ